MHVKFRFNAITWIVPGIFFGALTLFIHRFIPAPWIENVYSRFLFRILRNCFDYTVGLLPIPFVYILVPILIYGIYQWIGYIRRYEAEVRNRTLRIALSILAFFGWIVFLFYLLWGFNYYRVSLEEQLSLKEFEISVDAFQQEFVLQTRRVASLRTAQKERIDSLIEGWSFSVSEKEIRLNAENLLNTMGYPVPGRVRCRELYPRGILLRMGTAGFYNPFTGECNIDPGLHTLQKPFVLAHELFHGLGITGEGECNFLAYLASHFTDDPLIKYSGELGYWRYLAGSLNRRYPDFFKEHIQMIPSEVKDDIREIDNTIDKYPNVAPKMRDAIYDAYLQSNRVQMGMADYARVIQMVIRWRNEQETSD